MKSILARVLELKSDPAAADRGAKVLASLHFRPVTDTMTGEDFALTLAAIIAHGEQQANPTTQTKVAETPQGRVFSASIADRVSVKQSIGG